jgi:hypothetical protein
MRSQMPSSSPARLPTLPLKLLRMARRAVLQLLESTLFSAHQGVSWDARVSALLLLAAAALVKPCTCCRQAWHSSQGVSCGGGGGGGGGGAAQVPARSQLSVPPRHLHTWMGDAELQIRPLAQSESEAQAPSGMAAAGTGQWAGWKQHTAQQGVSIPVAGTGLC